MLEDLKKNPAAVDPDAESLARLKALRGEPAQQPAPPKIPFPVAQVICAYGAAEHLCDQITDVVHISAAFASPSTVCAGQQKQHLWAEAVTQAVTGQCS